MTDEHAYCVYHSSFFATSSVTMKPCAIVKAAAAIVELGYVLFSNYTVHTFRAFAGPLVG